MQLNDFELKKAASNPDVLRALAEEHSCAAAMADAIGVSELTVSCHLERAIELKMAADKIDAEI